MTTEEPTITRTTVTAEVLSAVEGQLTAVNAAIAEHQAQLEELHTTRTWLEGVLAAAGGTGPAPAPAPAAASAATPPPAREKTKAPVPVTAPAVPAEEEAASSDKAAGWKGSRV